MRELLYLTAYPEIVCELGVIVPDVHVIARRINSLPQQSIDVLAKKIASDAWLETGKTVLAILADFYFDSPASFYSPCPPLSDLHAVADEHAGHAGVMRVSCAVTNDGTVFHTDERHIPGEISSSPRGTLGTPLDRLWVLNGYRRTISELIEFQPHLNRRDRAYRMVANLLGGTAEQPFYEAHITVEMPDGRNERMFRDVCAALGIKAIHIELDAGKMPTHLITGSIHRGELSKVQTEVEKLARLLEGAGLRPTRHKIEAMIQNSLVPLTDEDASRRPPSNYFEFHTKVTIHEKQDTGTLQNLCHEFQAHLARSASNKLDGGFTQRFVTVRFHNEGRATAESTFARLVEQLRENGYQPSHLLKEYVIVDTNLDLDAGWADSSVPDGCYTNCDKLEANACPFQDGASRKTSEPFVSLSEVTSSYGA